LAAVRPHRLLLHIPGQLLGADAVDDAGDDMPWAGADGGVRSDIAIFADTKEG